jgi:hypothetical protein
MARPCELEVLAGVHLQLNQLFVLLMVRGLLARQASRLLCSAWHHCHLDQPPSTGLGGQDTLRGAPSLLIAPLLCLIVYIVHRVRRKTATFADANMAAPKRRLVQPVTPSIIM